MLILKGQPILTCYDLINNFSLGEVLCQKHEFLIFAKGNLQFDETQRRCVEIFERAMSINSLRPCKQSSDFWEGKVPIALSPSTLQLLEECYAIYHESDNDRLFSMASAALILANQKSPEPLPLLKEKTEPLRRTLDLSQNNCMVYSGYTYFCGYSSGSELDMDKDLRMKTISVKCKRQNAGQAVLYIKNSSEEISLRIDPEEMIFLNVIGTSIASILPNEIKVNNGIIKRTREGILINGTPGAVPNNASSFAFRTEREGVYLVEGKLQSVGMQRPTINFSGLNQYYLVEVAYSQEKGNYLFLRNNGLVLGEDAQKEFPDRYVSIKAALTEGVN